MTVKRGTNPLGARPLRSGSALLLEVLTKKGLKTWQKGAKGKTLNNANQNSIMEERTMSSPLVWQLPTAKRQVRRAAAGHPPQPSTAPEVASSLSLHMPLLTPASCGQGQPCWQLPTLQKLVCSR